MSSMGSDLLRGRDDNQHDCPYYWAGYLYSALRGVSRALNHDDPGLAASIARHELRTFDRSPFAQALRGDGAFDTLDRKETPA
jgi:hypothetical protein